MVILRTRNKITDLLMILAWASPFNIIFLICIIYLINLFNLLYLSRLFYLIIYLIWLI